MIQSSTMSLAGRLLSRYSSLCLLFVAAMSSICSGQTVLTPGTVVTGQCQGHEKEPACTLPSAFGPGGLTLFAAPQFPHYAHFAGAAQSTLSQTLGTSIATQLA